MEEIGTYEAKTRFTELLRRAEAGESFTITRRGKPVAVLQSNPHATHSEIEAAKQRILERRKAFKLPEGVSIKDLINEGRRY